ncbi:MAG: ABC transporter ATP-binding protein [Candidatus Thalassarchaeaceae archaeon]|jgi:ABC-2 type transport system ATP-binding protein|nr:ABC transporter ATP-binding protein [Candidatus Thalassarchaeaceae archaeon]
MSSEALVEAKDLGKRFGDFVALHPLDVTVFAGEFFGVFGPNGAGKSTFIKLLTGQLSPSLGGAKILGTNVANDPQKVKANVGIVPESESPPSYLTAAEYLHFVCQIRGIREVSSKVEYWLDWFGLNDKKNTLCKDLSKGQRQKVMLAGAFIHEPRLLFLDEPFVNLDPIYQRKCRQLLMDHIESGGTIFLCSHILEVAERMCTRVAVIDHGRVLAAGTMDELRISEEEDLEDIFIRLVGSSVHEIELREDSIGEEE